MTIRKFSLLISLLLSICFAYSQSSIIDITVDNDTDFDYTISLKFNQQVVPSSGSAIFGVHANSNVNEVLEFEEDDVNLEIIKCYEPSTPTPIGNITISSGTGAWSWVSPWDVGTYSIFEFQVYQYAGITETFEFDITH